jgi:N-acetylneuraminate synthase/N,N'-diacetyllegionaminate synthase
MMKHKHVMIIAEAGVNHNGDVAIAHDLIAAAHKAGADAVKFQTFKSELVVSRFTGRASYQERNMPGVEESQLQMIRRLELRQDDFRELREHCDRLGIMFMTTTADIPSTEEMAPLVPVFKVGSSDINNFPLLKCLAQYQKPVILSTGMATLGEIERALKILDRDGIEPGHGFPPVSLLHCTTNYPCPYDEVNLEVIRTLKACFNLPVGYSDHTAGHEVAVAAVALGAHIIEKHLTLDRNMEGPDHKASLEPDEFARLTDSVRNIEAALGDGVKSPTQSEMAISGVARKSLVASRDISAGERIQPGMVAVKRPGTGIPPQDMDAVIGMTLVRSKLADEALSWEDFKHAD